MSEKENKPGNSNKRVFTVVVSGSPVQVEANINTPLHTIIPLALKDHPGQASGNWELRDAAGNLLDPNRKIEDYNFPLDMVLYLNPPAGVAG